MPVPVFTPRHTIDLADVAELRTELTAIIDRHGGVVIDCADLDHVCGAGMRVLEVASRHGSVSLANASPVMRLLAAVFGLHEPEFRVARLPGVEYSLDAAARSLRAHHPLVVCASDDN